MLPKRGQTDYHATSEDTVCGVKLAAEPDWGLIVTTGGVTLGSKVDGAIAALTDAPKSQRCRELVGLLESLGFRVRDGSKGGHKIVSHPGLVGWFGTNFNCGHGPGDLVKPEYVRRIRRVLEEQRDRLSELGYD